MQNLWTSGCPGPIASLGVNQGSSFQIHDNQLPRMEDNAEQDPIV